jgi:GNAT superfamily N-acetyltransferase
MMTVERLTPAWHAAFLASHNVLFTKIPPEYLKRLDDPHSPFPVRTFIARDGAQVAAWGRFYQRTLQLYGDSAPPLKVAMACAIGTLPDHQRKGLGRKVWRAAEDASAKEVDAVVVYTSEGGMGYPFYRAQGYSPLFFPRPMRLSVSGPARSQGLGTTTMPFKESAALSIRRGELFASCYRGYGGFMGQRPGSLDQWATVSFFYDPPTVGCIPQISRVEDTTGHWIAYAIWAGPIRNVGWKKDLVEIWELACADNCDVESLRRVLQPACAAASDGKGHIDWWAVPGHALTERMLTLGFTEMSRSLCVLGRILDPPRMVQTRLQSRNRSVDSMECRSGANSRVEIRLDDCHVEIEIDGATRMLFGRSTASREHQHGSLTIRPLQKTQPILETLDEAFPLVRWSYFASEFI